VAVGAAAQAAAVLTGATPDAVGAAWARADRVVVNTEPRIGATTSLEIRARYREAARTFTE
jgi:hypothetical protein